MLGAINKAGSQRIRFDVARQDQVVRLICYRNGLIPVLIDMAVAASL